MKKLLSLMCSLLMIVTLCGCSSTQDQQEEVTLTLAAAASLENTFEDKLIPEFEKENPNIKVQGVYDSSGKLQIQIEQGLKADVFFSAATKQMDALVDEKYINKFKAKKHDHFLIPAGTLHCSDPPNPENAFFYAPLHK